MKIATIIVYMSKMLGVLIIVTTNILNTVHNRK